MAEYLLIIGRKEEEIVYVCNIDSEVRFEDVEKFVENELKANNPECTFEIVCDKVLYEVSKYFLINEQMIRKQALTEWDALNKDLGVIEENISHIRNLISKSIVDNKEED
jgi:hypothetical protein